jgi:PhnB protein
MGDALPYVNNGFGVVRPYLYGHLDGIDFLQRVFDAEILEKHERSATDFHVEFRIGDSVVVMEASDPPHPSAPASVYVYVEDVDATYARALAAGACSISAPAVMPYQERACGVRDSYGNIWWISTYLPAQP